MNIGILISGRGSNMVALVDAVSCGDIPGAEVAVVISDKPGAAGLEKARQRGVETVVVERKGRSREDHDVEIADELRQRSVELICLAGYMRLLSPAFVEAFPNKIINIHPALLPKYGGKGMYGGKVHEAVIHSKEKESGITIHFVDEIYDHGKIIFQATCNVDEKDTPETLAKKIHVLEHEHYPAVIEKYFLQ